MAKASFFLYPVQYIGHWLSCSPTLRFLGYYKYHQTNEKCNTAFFLYRFVVYLTIISVTQLYSKESGQSSHMTINLLTTDFFFQILAHPVCKMWVIQKPNKVALWNKRHFVGKKWRLYSMFKIFSTDICWINIKWGIRRVILRPSYIWDARFLKVNFYKTKKKQKNKQKTKQKNKRKQKTKKK